MLPSPSPAATALPQGVLPGGRFDAWQRVATSFALCDVDGTLIGTDHLATDRVVAAIAQAQRAGIRVGIATGRMRTSVDRLRAQLGATGPHVFHNGAEFQVDGCTSATWTLSPANVDTLLGLVRRRDDCYLEICLSDGLYVSADDRRAAGHWEMLGVDPSGTVDCADDLAGRTVVKATLVAFDVSATILDELTALVERQGMAVGAAHSPRTPRLFYLNITHPRANKGSAAARAAAAVGVELVSVAAIGDGLNDLPLFTKVGTAIAMGQAPDEVCAAAHLIVPPVDEDGAALALETLASWPGVRDRQDEPPNV